MPGRGPFDFGPLMRQLSAMHFDGPVEIFMHPVPRGVPILDTVAAITAEVNRARTALLAGLAGGFLPTNEKPRAGCRLMPAGGIPDRARRG